MREPRFDSRGECTSAVNAFKTLLNVLNDLNGLNDLNLILVKLP